MTKTKSSMKREDKYVVMKIEDFNRYLNQEQQRLFFYLSNIISKRRLEDNKLPNSYWVVNVNEPYADIVEKLVLGKPIDLYEQGKSDALNGKCIEIPPSTVEAWIDVGRKQTLEEVKRAYLTKDFLPWLEGELSK